MAAYLNEHGLETLWGDIEEYVRQQEEPVPIATSDEAGIVKPDNVTLTVSDGTLSAVTTAESDGSTAGPIATLTAKGHAEQGSTTGKNLLPNTVTTQTKNGVTFTVNADGSFHIQGTVTENIFLTIGTVTLADGTYTLSGCPSGGGNSTYRLYYNKSGRVAFDTGNGVTFTANNDGAVSVRIAIYADTVMNHDFYPQLESGSTATAYEPYTGGVPSPSPDYPQEIQVVRGHEVSGKSGRYVSLEITHDGTTTTIPIPLPQRGWVAGLPDGTADTLTLDGAGKVTWEMACEEETFDGNEGWSVSGGGNRVYTNATYPIVNITAGVLGKHICDHFPTVTGAATYNGTLGCGVQDRRLNFSDGTGTMTVADWTAWLAENPVTVLYPLATPVTEEMGYVDLPTIPEGASISIPELDALNVRYHISVASVLAAYESRIAALEAAIAELATS